jgi:hypothetical protein
MNRFTQTISIIGVNPYVTVPPKIAQTFGKKGFIPVQIKVNGHPFLANLVPIGGGRYRLYLHGLMRKKAKAQVGDRIAIELVYDLQPRVEPMSKPLTDLLKTNLTAWNNWKSLSPSRRKEINRYLNRLKSDKALRRNLARVMSYLEGQGDWFKRRI